VTAPPPLSQPLCSMTPSDTHSLVDLSQRVSSLKLTPIALRERRSQGGCFNHRAENSRDSIIFKVEFGVVPRQYANASLNHLWRNFNFLVL
jgi:hypothetical protein